MFLRYKDASRGSEDEAEDDDPKPATKSARKQKKEKPQKPKGKTSEKKKELAGTLYEAGNYKTERLQWIREAVAAKGVSFREAGNLWNSCERRSQLLEGMSKSELIRRRFALPSKGGKKPKA